MPQRPPPTAPCCSAAWTRSGRLGVDGASLGLRRAQLHRAFLARRLAEEIAIALGEVRGGDEAAGERDVDNRHVSLQQQQPRPVEPQLDVVARRRAVEILAEQALELAA